jgi:hypothetical protein
VTTVRDNPFSRAAGATRICVALFAAALPVAAQQFTPHIGYVYPAGGRQGSSFQITIGGQFLDGVTNALVSGTGVQATVLEFTKPMAQGEFNRLRDQYRELQEKHQSALKSARKGNSNSSTNFWTTADEKRMTEIRTKILKNPPNRQATSAIAENVILRVALSTNAEAGERELRLEAALGLSNPIKFCIGQLPEVSEAPAKAPNPEVDRFLERLGRAPSKAPAQTETPVSFPGTINGQITPGDVDRYRFHARRGQHIVAAASARALIPYLADAVPGWFQATLALYDMKGREVAYDDDFRFHPDPVLHFEIPSDGDYVLAIKDALYRGREDFVYRLTLGELPFVTSIFPVGGHKNQSTTVELSGWNLPTNMLVVPPLATLGRIVSVSLPEEQRFANLLPFALDTQPEVTEVEPNDSSSCAQKIALPCIINGRVNRPGDQDVFRFEGNAGDEIVAEVEARRLDSPLDSVLKLSDSNGNQLAWNDDYEDKGSGLNTHHADSYLRARLPATADYSLQIADTQHKGAADYVYRVRVSAPRPDFDLRLVPSSVNVRPGVSVPLTIFALRKDGFTNEISIALKEPLHGFVLEGGRIPAGQDQVRITLNSGTASPETVVNLLLEGRASLNGAELVHEAIPADDLMQAFAYRHLVPARQLAVKVLGRGLGRPAKVLADSRVKIPAGGTALVSITAPASVDRFQFELSDPPEGIAIRKVSPTDRGAEILLASDAAKSKLGLKGNLIINIIPAPGRPMAATTKKPAAVRRSPVGTLPAIPFEIVLQ